MKTSGTTAPQNIEAEEHVIGAILLAQSVPTDIIEEVSPKHFYRQSHGTIYQAALSLQLQGKPTDAVSVSAELEKMGKLSNVGGTSRIAELAALVPTVSNAGHYAKIVRDKATLRGLLEAGQRIQSLAADGRGETEDIIREAEQLLHGAADKGTTLSALPISEALDELIDSIREAYTTGRPNTGLSTGFPDLDKMIHGLWPSRLYLLAARTGQGKSTLAQNIAENVADIGQPVLFISLEMSRYELQLRSLARAGRIDGDRLATGLITNEEASRLGGAVEMVKARRNFLIHDEGLANPSSLAALARRHNEKEPLGLIVVDYIGLMQGQGENQTQRIASVSRALKMLAMNLHVPILAVSQMNRKQDDRTDKEPMLSDLRDSGALEQDANVVMFLHRESDVDPSIEDDGSVKLIVAKNRHGKSGFTTLTFNKSSSRFLNPSLLGGRP